MHKVVKTAVVGSTGDLGKIAQALADAGFNIESIGATEATIQTPGGPRHVGTLALLVTPDEDQDEPRIKKALRETDLGDGRNPLDIEILASLELRLPNTPGTLAKAATLLGSNGIDIGGIVFKGTEGDDAWVCLGFENAAKRDDARDLLTSNQFDIRAPHSH